VWSDCNIFSNDFDSSDAITMGSHELGMNNNPSVVQQASSSAEFVEAIFRMHMMDVRSVLDLTYGNGTFWNWDVCNICPKLFLHPLSEFTPDFRNTLISSRKFQCVVFDPPFTANGPSEQSHNARYGSDRSQSGTPQNIHEVRTLLAQGLLEAMRISSKWVLLKTQDVIESGKLHSSVNLAYMLFEQFGYRVVDYVLYDAPRRPQPDSERGATVRHFRNRPSVFILASRKS
jgi:hypothetical protein